MGLLVKADSAKELHKSQITAVSNSGLLKTAEKKN